MTAPSHPIPLRETPAGTTPPQPRDVPVLVFRVVALLVIGFLVTGPGGAAGLLAPLTSSAGHLHGDIAELHRWHTADIAAYVSLLTVGTLGVAMWRPRQALGAMRALVGSLVGFAGLALLMPAPEAVLVPLITVLVLLGVTYPARRELLRPFSFRPRSPVALLAAAVPTPFLANNLWVNLDLQIGGTDPHAVHGHWAGAAALALGLLISGWLAASSLPGARRLGAIVGSTYAYLALASLSLARYDGAWGRAGTAVAVVSSALFAIANRRPDASDLPTSAATSGGDR